MGQTTQWIHSFLSEGKQNTVLKEISSDVAYFLSGVPQGSVLGPSLFLLYINDVPNSLVSNVRLFADDTVVYLTIHSDGDTHVLQNDLDKLADWGKRWKMQFHPEKCQVLRAGRKRNLVQNNCPPWKNTGFFQISRYYYNS